MYIVYRKQIGLHLWCVDDNSHQYSQLTKSAKSWKLENQPPLRLLAKCKGHRTCT